MTDVATRPAEAPAEPLDPSHLERMREPGGRGGLVDVFRSRVIVQLLVRRDVRLKYRYSSIGFAWAYVRPTVQFCVYYFVVGVLLDLDRRVENFPVYIFSGLCLLHFFNDTLQSCTRSVIRNRAIVKKIWLPREVFPVAGVFVAATRFIPQLVILLIAATVTGWYVTWEGLAAAAAGFAIVFIWGSALGLLLSAMTVYIREIQNFLEFTGFLTHWLTPMFKPWTLVSDAVSQFGTLGAVLLAAYIWNPLCTAVELFHLAFWSPTVDFYFELSPQLWTRTWVFLASGLLVLLLAPWVFRRLQASFAEEL
jgi:ABC-2 type transport system permease protein